MIRRTVKPPLSILVCEDEPLIRYEVAEVLKHLGYTVKVSATVAEARRVLELQTYDILLVDVELPNASGVDLAQIARALDPNIGVIFATGHVAAPAATAIRDSVLLNKPYGEAQLVRAIGRVTR